MFDEGFVSAICKEHLQLEYEMPFYKRQNIWIEISPKLMSHTMHLRSFNLGIKKLKMTWRPTVFIITYQAVLAHRFILVGVAQQWWVDESLSPAWLAVKGEVGMEDQNV